MPARLLKVKIMCQFKRHSSIENKKPGYNLEDTQVRLRHVYRQTNKYCYYDGMIKRLQIFFSNAVTDLTYNLLNKKSHIPPYKSTPN